MQRRIQLIKIFRRFSAAISTLFGDVNRQKGAISAVKRILVCAQRRDKMAHIQLHSMGETDFLNGV